MTRGHHRRRGTSRAAAVLLLASLIFGQLGFGSALLVLWTGSSDACLDDDCPCEEGADADRDDRDEGATREGVPNTPCPPRCDEAACCPGALTAIVATNDIGLPGPRRVAALVIALHDPVSLGPARVYRPPRHSLV